MKQTLVFAISTCAAASMLADTITWTGNGDGVSWSDTANWEAASTGQTPGRAPLQAENTGDQVVISGSGVTVEYNAGDPWLGAAESITVSDGATLVQTVASWWHGAGGTVVIDGGTFDTGSCSGTHAWAGFTVVNGGSLVARTPIPDANVAVDASSTYEAFSANNHAHTGTEAFTRFTASAQNVELTATAETASFDDDIAWSVNLVSAAGVALRWNAGSLVSWDTSWGGYYNAGGTLDIAAGWTGSFTFAYAPSAVFASCFQNKITYDGTALTAESFEELFTVEATTVTDPNGNIRAASRVSLATASEWKIGTLHATDITASSATVSATITAVVPGAGYTVLSAFGTGAIDEASILSGGTAVAVADGVCSNALSGLAENTPYYYAFAIVTNGAIAAFKASSFVASDYDFVYIGGAWAGGLTPALGGASTESVLFADDFSTAGELRGDNKMVRDSVLTSGTLIYGTLRVVNASVVNTRAYLMNQAPYGFYGDNAIPLDFSSESGNGTLRRAPSYTFRCTAAQFDAFYATEIAGGRLTLDGEPISAAGYSARFTLSEDGTEEGTVDGEGGPQSVSAKVATLTCWDILPANASGDWTLRAGARAKLSGATRLGALVVESADAKIDLAGQNLRVGSLSIEGVAYKGTHTAATLPSLLAGAGTLEVVESGTMIYLR